LADLARLRLVDCRSDGWHQRKEVVESIAASNQDDDGEIRPNEVLLKLEISVGGYKNLEPSRMRSPQQLAIFQA